MTDRIVDAYADRLGAAATALNLESLVRRSAIRATPHRSSTDLVTAGDALGRTGDWLRDEQENLVATADASLRGGHPGAAGLANAVLACVPYASGTGVAALERLAAMVRQAAVTSGDAEGLALAEYYLGRFRRSQGDLPAAIQRLESSAEQARAQGNAALLGWALRELGQLGPPATRSRCAPSRVGRTRRVAGRDRPARSGYTYTGAGVHAVVAASDRPGAVDEVGPWTIRPAGIWCRCPIRPPPVSRPGACSPGRRLCVDR